MQLNVTNLFENYSAHWRSRTDVSDYTKRSYIGVIRSFSKFCVRRLPTANSCTSNELRDLAIQYTDWISSELGYSVSSSNLTASALISFFITSGIESPELSRQKALRRRPQVLEGTELENFVSIVQNCQYVRDRLIAKAFLYLGLRVKECCALRVSDVVLENDIYSVRVSKRGSRPLITDVREDLQNDIRDWLRIRQNINPANDALFVTRMGGELSIGSITFVVRRLGLQARLVLAPQILRNTCVSNMASETDDLYAIAAAAGFRTLDSARRYAAR
jgi:site-specific recombinase XerC